MIPKIIHQIWVGADPLPDQFAPLVEKVKAMHPGWDHRLWTEQNLPEQMIRTEWRDRLRYPAERSDLLRLELLYEYGGIYLDVDFDLRKPLDPLLELAPVVISDLKVGRVNNAFIGAVPGHPLIHTLILEAQPREYFGFEKSACGPLFVDRVLAPHKDSGEIKVLHYTSFYPFLPEEMEHSYALHIGERSWKLKGEWKKAALLAEDRLRAANQRIFELESLTKKRWLVAGKSKKRLKRALDMARARRKRWRKRVIRAIRVVRFSTAAWGSRSFGTPLHRSYLPDLLNKLELAGAGAEIGVKRGIYSETILARWKCKRLYLVDPWEEQNDETYFDRANVDQEKHDAYYQETLERLQRFNGRFEIVRDYSIPAAARMPDGSLDFVYLDARHDYESVLEDLRTWEPKVRIGGVIAGHDYLQGVVNGMPYGVKSAVSDFFRERRYSPSILKRTWEPWPSFYWIRTSETASRGERAR